MAKDASSLTWDYVVFVVFIVFSTIAPLWSSLFGKKKGNSKANYVFAVGGVPLIAMMLSIARGTLGIRSVLGYPAELFYRGTGMWEIIYGLVNAYPIVCFIFIPVYFNLKITSAYQYLDLRFKSRLIRCLASGTYILRQILSLGVTVYTPSVAMATVIGIPYWVSITGMSLICIIFTIVGGLKAAINADVIQTISVASVTIAVIIRGTITAGGPKNVFDRNYENGRFKFFNFTGDMTVRVDTLSAWLGQLFMSMSQFGCQQNFIQRYASLKSISEVNRVLMSNIPVIITFFSLSWICGMAVYATYVDCDPLASGFIQKTDEILPFFVADKLSFIPGFVGIFMATLFNGALSMNVSNLNSLSTVVWEDFIGQLPQFKGLKDSRQLFIIKLIAVIFGILTAGIAFGVGMLPGVIDSSLMAFSATSGPLLGAFVLAMLVPFANWKGASLGMVVGHIAIMWMAVGGLTMDKPPLAKLPTSVEGCNDTFAADLSKPPSSWMTSQIPIEIEASSWNQTLVTTWSPPGIQERHFPENIYAVSYMYYAFFGTAIVIIVGIVVSLLTYNEEDKYSSKLLHPLVFKLSERLPGKKSYFIETEPPPEDDHAEKITCYENPTLTLELNEAETVQTPNRIAKKSPQNPDILECNHWESATGTYRTKNEDNVNQLA